MWRPRPQPTQPFAPAKMLRLVTLLAVVAVLGLGAGLWQLQKPAEKDQLPPVETPVATPPKEEGPEDIFMSEESQREQRREQLASVTCVVAVGTVGGKGALTNLALMKTDRSNLFWAEAERVPKLRSDYLSKVRDFNKVGTWTSNEGEAASYCDALINANRTEQAVFARDARRDLTYVHLFEEPAKFRGDVVHIQGHVRLLHRYDPPLMAQQAGVKDLYEAWVFDDRYRFNPYCVLLTELPAGMTASGAVDHRVSFDGYFFKRYRYKAVDNVQANQFRDAPLLIGRTLVPLEPLATTAADSDWSGWLLPGFMVLLAGTAFFTVGLLWWFRREDRRVRERVSMVYGDEFVPPPPDPEPPVAPPVHPSRSRSSTAGEPRKSNHYTHGHDKGRAVHRALGQGGIDSS